MSGDGDTTQPFVHSGEEYRRYSHVALTAIRKARDASRLGEVRPALRARDRERGKKQS